MMAMMSSEESLDSMVAQSLLDDDGPFPQQHDSTWDTYHSLRKKEKNLGRGQIKLLKNDISREFLVLKR